MQNSHVLIYYIFLNYRILVIMMEKDNFYDNDVDYDAYNDVQE